MINKKQERIQMFMHEGHGNNSILSQTMQTKALRDSVDMYQSDDKFNKDQSGLNSQARAFLQKRLLQRRTGFTDYLGSKLLEDERKLVKEEEDAIDGHVDMRIIYDRRKASAEKKRITQVKM